MDEILHQKTLTKKAHFVWFQVGDFNISDIFYKIQNFNKWPVLLVITNWTYTFLSPWALKKFCMATITSFFVGLSYDLILFLLQFSSIEVAQNKMDWVGPVDNRPSTDMLHHFVKKKP